jgi:hypothetical protein
MRVNRTLLYAGIFLVAIGGVVVAADLGVVGESILTGALRFWPLAVIALGLGLVLRRTRVSLSGGMLAAAVPGLLLGSAFAVVPRFTSFCGSVEEPTRTVTEQGTFDGPAGISVITDCGSLVVTTAPGSDWRLDARTTEEGRLPVVSESARSLSITSTGHDGWLGAGSDDWDLALPTSQLGNLSLTVNAGRGDIDLAEAQVERLSVKADAADVVLDASAASIASLTAVVNLGQLSVDLPASDLTGSFRVSAGNVQVCAPRDLGLRVTSSGDAREITVAGLHQAGPIWESAGYASADHRADLQVRVDFGAVEINPIGGCR